MVNICGDITEVTDCDKRETLCYLLCCHVLLIQNFDFEYWVSEILKFKCTETMYVCVNNN